MNPLVVRRPPHRGRPSFHFRSLIQRQRQSSRRTSRGIVLVMALILLAVIGVSSALAMRATLFSDMVSKNMRAQNLALQAAELALRHCERLITWDPGSVVMLSGLGLEMEWQTEARWTASALTVPVARLGADAGYRIAPQCLVRLISVDEFFAAFPPDPTSISAESRGYSSDYVVLHRVTARGFSPDYERSAGGLPVAGAEVWLQTLVRGVQ